MGDHFERSICGFLAGGVPSQSVDHQENAALLVHVAAILVLAAHPAGIGGRAGLPVGHGFASKFSMITSATLICARPGNASSTPRASRFPFSQVPFMLLSTIKNRPWDGSRRNRRCSRETSSL